MIGPWDPFDRPLIFSLATFNGSGSHRWSHIINPIKCCLLVINYLKQYNPQELYVELPSTIINPIQYAPWNIYPHLP